MAFPWEVEALRKMIEATIASTAAEHNIAQDSLKEERDIWEEERFGEYPEPDDVAPEDWFGGYQERERRAGEMLPWEGNVFQELAKAARDEEEAELDRDLAPFKRLYQQGKREAGRKVRKEGDKLKLDWVNEILKEFPDKKRPDPIAGREWWQLPDETAVKKRGKAGSDKWYENWEKAGLPNWFDIPPDEYEYVPDEAYGEIVKEQQKKNEEEKPDLSPILSYLLRQSPYARLPAAGLLGLGLMGYSKPAY